MGTQPSLHKDIKLSLSYHNRQWHAEQSGLISIVPISAPSCILIPYAAMLLEGATYAPDISF
jgi:hypothetical protein